MVFRTTSPAKVTQADLYADEVNDDSNRQTIIRSFESKENYTMEYIKNRIITLQFFFFQIIDESTRFAFRKLTKPRNHRLPCKICDRRRMDIAVGAVLPRRRSPRKCNRKVTKKESIHCRTQRAALSATRISETGGTQSMSRIEGSSRGSFRERKVKRGRELHLLRLLLLHHVRR